MDPNLRLVGFDGDDTLWRSEDYYRGAQDEFERIVARHVDLHDARAQERLYAVEKRNLALFGYGVKGMVLSMIEAAVESPTPASRLPTCIASSRWARTCCSIPLSCCLASAKRWKPSVPATTSC